MNATFLDLVENFTNKSAQSISRIVHVIKDTEHVQSSSRVDETAMLRATATMWKGNKS